jgi:pyrimidine-specific ribonucleoside hydrolase
VQPTVPYKKFPRGFYKFKTKKKVDYAIRALQGFEEKILETMSVKNK